MMDAILKGVTSSRGATCTFDYTQNAPVTYNDPALVTRRCRALLGGRRRQ
jgi:metal-dependent amidase/aminoacylase/carboxypeptidase family protein